MIGKQNIHKAIEAATQMAEAAAAEGKAFCVFRVDVGLDTNAIREAVLKVVEQKVGQLEFSPLFSLTAPHGSESGKLGAQPEFF